jgi:hypothetical protein
VFENRVLRRIFGPMRDEILRGWRNLHNEELHNLYTSANMIIINKLKEGEVGRECNMNESEEKYIQNFGRRT